VRGPEQLDQLDRIVDAVRAILGSNAVGAYLHGSLVQGGLKPHSDLDVLVVSQRATTEDEKRGLIARLLPMSGRGDPSGQARSIELTIVVQADVRPWRYPPPMDFIYGDWLRGQFEQGELTPFESPNPDLALVLTMVLRGNAPLFGPPPAELLDPVPREDLMAAIVAGIPGLLADLDDDTANVVLTFARIWLTLATGEIHPKDAAADWALDRLAEEHRPVLARARDVYLGTAQDRWDDLAASIRPHADAVLREIERLRP
jgi:streptomycin 3"-adenylyltransferase